MLAYNQHHRFYQLVAASDNTTSTRGPWTICIADDLPELVTISTIAGGIPFHKVQRSLSPYIQSYREWPNPRYRVPYYNSTTEEVEEVAPPNINLQHVMRMKTDDVLRHVMAHANKKKSLLQPLPQLYHDGRHDGAQRA